MTGKTSSPSGSFYICSFRTVFERAVSERERRRQPPPKLVQVLIRARRRPACSASLSPSLSPPPLPVRVRRDREVEDDKGGRAGERRRGQDQVWADGQREAGLLRRVRQPEGHQLLALGGVQIRGCATAFDTMSFVQENGGGPAEAHLSRVCPQNRAEMCRYYFSELTAGLLSSMRRLFKARGVRAPSEL